MCFNPVETGERIRRLREHLGYSQTQLSEKINFSRSYISKVEVGIRIKEKKAVIEQHRKENSQAMSRIESTADAIKQMPNHFTDWDESIIRQLVDTVKVVSADRIIVYLRSGTQVEQEIVKS